MHLWLEYTLEDILAKDSVSESAFCILIAPDTPSQNVNGLNETLRLPPLRLSHLAQGLPPHTC